MSKDLPPHSLQGEKLWLDNLPLCCPGEKGQQGRPAPVFPAPKSKKRPQAFAGGRQFWFGRKRNQVAEDRFTLVWLTKGK